jgi:hypothetical protein
VTTTRTFGLAAGEQPAPGYVWPTHREPAGQSNPSTLAVSRGPELPFRHPDLLVHRAVELRVLEAADAAAWIEVRLARRPVEVHAPLLGVTVNALRMRLARAGRASSGAVTSPPQPAAA